MGSLTQAMSIALSGLQTTTTQISLASKNISNAQTEGYSAKTVSTTSVNYGGEFGGVGIAGYSRATNNALTNNFNAATSAAGYSNTQNAYLAQVQTVLGSNTSTPTLAKDIANLSSAWEEYASSPESAIQKQSVITAGQTLANDMRSITTQIGSLRVQVQTDMTNDLVTLNSDLRQIADVNQAIQAASTIGQPTVDLQDQLDTLVNHISTYANVVTQPRANGQIALYTPTGTLLVDGPSAQSFSYSSGTILDSNGTDVTNSITGGSLQAQLQFIDTSTSAASSTTPGVGTLQKITDQLSKFVDALTNSSGTTPSAFATAYTNAYNSSTAAGGVQFGGTLASSFFTVTNNTSGKPDASTLNVTSTLTAGTADLPKGNVQAIAASFNSTATYTASGLNAPSVTYAGLASSILSGFQQTANTVSAQNTIITNQKNYYQQTLSNSTGVNIDTELASLVAYQNSYAASAHVISTVNQMLSTLMGVLG